MTRLRRQDSGVNPSTNVLIGTMYSYLDGKVIGTNPMYMNPATRGAYAWEAVCLDETHPGPPYRSGGPLMTFWYEDPGLELVGQGDYLVNYTSRISYRYVGGFFPSARIGDMQGGYSAANCHAEATEPGSVYPYENNAWQHGATGWNKFKPCKPTADAGVFLAEIRELPQMLKDTANFFQKSWRSAGGKRGHTPKGLANDWLAANFGWLPFISDLRKFHKTYRNLDQTLSRIKKQNGQWVKRGGTVSSRSSHEIVFDVANQTGHSPSINSAFFSNPSLPGSKRMARNFDEQVWFDACFRYWIPPVTVDTPIWRGRAIAELYGLVPNPALIWELTPFSWLGDWVSNAGDVLSNLSPGLADDLVAKYAYVMKSTSVEGRFDSTLNLKTGTLSNSWVFPISWKARAGASRFGFGLSQNDFSLRQWSILAALGIQGV